MFAGEPPKASRGTRTAVLYPPVLCNWLLLILLGALPRGFRRQCYRPWPCARRHLPDDLLVDLLQQHAQPAALRLLEPGLQKGLQEDFSLYICASRVQGNEWYSRQRIWNATPIEWYKQRTVPRYKDDFSYCNITYRHHVACISTASVKHWTHMKITQHQNNISCFNIEMLLYKWTTLFMLLLSILTYLIIL